MSYGATNKADARAVHPYLVSWVIGRRRSAGRVRMVCGVVLEYLTSELGAVDVQVDLGGGYGGVAEHHLYGVERCSAFEEMCGE